MTRIFTELFSIIDVYDFLVEYKPDLIFFHGLCSFTMNDCIKYKKEVECSGHSCIIIQDNHLDYNIGGTGKTIKEKIIKYLYRYYNKKTQKYIKKIYGVTPWRKQYAEEYYGIDASKTDVLIMGADDECIKFQQRDLIREQIRSKYQIANDSFLIITGGKLDKKKCIIELMNACSKIENVVLLIFGTVFKEIEEQFNSYLEKFSNIVYIGWVNSSNVYDYFFASDLVCFPGQHSVLWEQACAAKVPCLFRRWYGMEHVNNGGNSDFIVDISPNKLSKKIEGYIFTEKYYKMKSVAESKNTDIYLYSKIAEKSLECMTGNIE